MYCTTEDILKKISEKTLLSLVDVNKTNPATLAGAEDSVKDAIAGAISSAETEMNDYLRQAYTLPLDPAPADTLTRLCTDIAIYNIYCMRDFAEVPANWQVRYKNAIDFLKGVATKKFELGIGRDQPEQEQTDHAEYQGNSQTFNNSTLGGF